MQNRFREMSPHFAPVLSAAKAFYQAHRNLLLLVWDVAVSGVIGLNGFIMLLHRYQIYRELAYVICTGATLYFFTLVIQTVLLLHRDDRHEKLVAAKRVLRLIYASIYLTAIMLDVILLTQIPGTEWILVYKGLLFLWVCVWSTNFLWGKRVIRFFREALIKSARADS